MLTPQEIRDARELGRLRVQIQNAESSLRHTIAAHRGREALLRAEIERQRQEIAVLEYEIDKHWLED